MREGDFGISLSKLRDVLYRVEMEGQTCRLEWDIEGRKGE